MRTKLSLITLVLALVGRPVPCQHRQATGPRTAASPSARFDPELGDYSIWAANPDGTHQRRLTHVPSFFSDWSPDGRRIAFDFADDTGVHIATMDPNGRHVRQLTFGPAIQEIPEWSPDGRWITFGAAPIFPGEPGFHTDIWIMRANGSHKRQLTRGGFDGEPVFSPDGRRIAFARITNDAEFEVAIYVMNRDGSHLREVVPPTLGLEHPDWSPEFVRDLLSWQTPGSCSPDLGGLLSDPGSFITARTYPHAGARSSAALPEGWTTGTPLPSAAATRGLFSGPVRVRPGAGRFPRSWPW